MENTPLSCHIKTDYNRLMQYNQGSHIRNVNQQLYWKTTMGAKT
ncbi:hypothetical protein [Mucilaginibacter oryzae]|nr:hypothetical protein [Mucilaginibacter oryzae]